MEKEEKKNRNVDDRTDKKTEVACDSKIILITRITVIVMT